MTESIKKVIRKITNQEDNYTIFGDDTAKQWLISSKIKKYIRISQNIWSIWIEFEKEHYFAITDVDIPLKFFKESFKFLERQELNAGIWVSIISELELELKKDYDELNLTEVIEYIWKVEHKRSKIVFNEVVSSKSLEDFFPKIYLFKVLETLSEDQIYQITGQILSKSTSNHLLPYNNKILDKFYEIFEKGHKNIPFDNILASYTASDYRFAYLDLYRCLEKLQILFFFQKLHQEAKIQDSLIDFCRKFYNETKLEPKLSDSLKKLFRSVFDEKIAEKRADSFYKIRNGIVHLGVVNKVEIPNQTDKEKWNTHILDLIEIIMLVYDKNGGLLD